jgi:hypothetical protein
LIVPLRNLHWVASVAQIDKIYAFDDTAIFHIEARDNPFT